MKYIYLAPALLLGLSGCLTLPSTFALDSRPSPVINMNTYLDLTKGPIYETSYITKNGIRIKKKREVFSDKYTVYRALERFHDPNKTLDERTFIRNDVAAIYLAASDARYTNFLIGLSKEKKYTNIVADLLSRTLTGFASLSTEPWTKGAAAGANLITGTNNKADAELYYEQSFSALLSIMDAERLQVRYQIIDALKKPANEYGMAAFFTDLSRMGQRSSLDHAAAELARQAAKHSLEVEEDAKTLAKGEKNNAIDANGQKEKNPNINSVVTSPNSS